MKLSPMKDILGMAEERSITYSARVTVPYKTALAAIEAGTELGIPVIFITGMDCYDLMGGLEGTVDATKRATKTVDRKVSIALHLDHCRIYRECAQTTQAEYPSVMVDSSFLPSEEDVTLTEKVADYTHCYGITVERESGELVGEEGSFRVEDDPESAQTDPDQTKGFVERTSIDYIAVSIGMQHGVYVVTPRLNTERLKKIHDVVDTPIVLYGSPGTPKEQIQEVVRNGVRKINIVADVLIAVVNSFEDMKQKSDLKYNTGMFVNSQACVREFIEGKTREFALMG